MIKKRAIGVIIKNNKILLIKRIKPNEEYYTFPGGSVEKNEPVIEAVKREINEELSIKPELDRYLFRLDNQGRMEYYFLITKYRGKMQLGGEEKERMNEDNQYHPTWIELNKIDKLDNLYPREAVKELQFYLFHQVE